MPVSSVTEHWIKQDALIINLNHFGDPDYLQVSILAGAVVMAFKKDVIGYNASHNYRTWPLQAANTYLETSSAVNVYARLTRSEVNASALIVYDPVLRDIEGRKISYDENGNELLGESDSSFFYVFVGQISESLDSNGNKKTRAWNRSLVYGTLDSSEQKNYAGLLWEMMFTPHFDNPLNPDELTWIEAKKHIGVSGGLTLNVNNGKINLPSIYDGLPIDHDTIYWENGVLKAKGGGGGIESITKQMVIEALGFTPYSASNPNGYITAASIPSALKNPYALTFGSKTYDGSSAKEITASDLGAALSSDLSKYLPISSYTASDVLAKLVTVDGSGSGLDADTLDGKQATSFVWEDMYPNSSDNNYALNTGIYRTTSNTEGLPYKNNGNSVIHCNWDNNAANQLFLRYDGDYIAYRRKDGNAWKPWKQLAFTDSNVASATYATTSGNADTLDGVHASKLYQVNSAVDLGGTTSNYDTLIVRYNNTSATSNHPYSIVGGNQCVALNLYAGTDYAAQLAVGFGFNYLAYRRKINSTSWQSWVKINAGLADEATKLQTARTIWGQSFDGTGNVDGALQIKAGNYIANRATLILNSNRGHAGDIIFKSGSTTKGNYGWWAISSRNDSTGVLAIYRGPENGANPTESRVITIEPSGNILTTGGVTMYSQRSLKNVVDERGLTLNELSAIKPTRYTWKDKRDDRLHFGGIADDIQQVLPEVVYKTEEGVLTMDYGNAGFAIASSLIKPVIDHEERIKALERENEMLKQELNRLRA